MGEIVLHHADNSVFVDDGCVDLVLTDPPFNISRETNFSTYYKNSVHSFSFDKDSENRWDSVDDDAFLQMMDSWCKEWFRVLRRGGSFVVFCADRYISSMCNFLEDAGLAPSRVFSWRKNNAVPVNRKYLPMSSCEYAIVGVKPGGKRVFNSTVSLSKIDENDANLIESVIVADKVASIVNRELFDLLRENSGALFDDSHVDVVVDKVKQSFRNVLEVAEKRVRGMFKDSAGVLDFCACVPNSVEFPLKTGARIHPTEKNHNLLSYFVALFSNSGDLVFDGFAGSGSTGLAAYELGRSSVLVERESSFVRKSEEWLRGVAGDDFLIVDDCCLKK